MREYGDFNVARALRYAAGLDQKSRLPENKCRYCFYMGGGLAGQAFTNWKCVVCDKEDLWPNTAVPKVCSKCAKKNELCVTCGGDVHQRTGRRKWRK